MVLVNNLLIIIYSLLTIKHEKYFSGGSLAKSTARCYIYYKQTKTGVHEVIIGQGLDIVEIERIASAIERSGDAFIRRVYTAAEIAQAEARNQAKYTYYAGRWAAKEALAKALRCGIGKNCSFTDIEILTQSNGAPKMFLSGNAKEYCDKSAGKYLHVSISHEKNCAAAIVTIEK